MNMTIIHRDMMKFEVKVRGHKIIADQPLSGGGRDAGPTPGEYFVLSLGTCIGAYIVSHCQKMNLSCEGMRIEIDWEKASAPSRISAINIKVIIPEGIPEDKKQGIIAVAHRCTVHNSIINPPDIKIILREG